MSTIIKQTSRQVKAAYRKSDGRLSDREIQRLEHSAAADRHAEELREKEKRSKEAKKRREDKERKQRDALRRNGIGDATQACGWNFTQRRQKDWFRTYLRKDQPKPAPDPKPKDANPFKSSQISHPEDTDERLEKIDDLVHNSGGEAEEDIWSKGSGSDHVHNADAKPVEHIRNDADWVEDAQGEDRRCHHHPALNHTPCEPRSRTNSVENKNNLHEVSAVFEREPKELGSAPDSGSDSDNAPLETDNSYNNNSLATYNVALANIRPSDEPTEHEANPWSTDDIDEESLLAAVQGQTPTSKASLTASAAPSGEVDADLPLMDTELLEELLSNSQLDRDLTTPTHFQPYSTLSDSFFSSELDLSAEELAAIETPLIQTQPRPSRDHAADQTKVRSVVPPGALGDVSPESLASDPPLTPPTRQAQKRKAVALNDHESSSPKQRKEPDTRCTSADYSMLPPPKPASPEAHHTSDTSLHESRFAAYGLSTQLIQDAAFDDFDF
ncbi:tyrosine recombinase [Diplodia corticola]|uniref:Tyrosine recombinase n=1 Tax=Diplodia corticola TaxID=236234 RepID=A0A1J9RJF6_9PEZI|nr:tyrosine recombinase [Diplodia corticola]OJD40792.1 tyrosine recombinase [Diplodia corticola]